MTGRTVWVASYPKSGNTWVRAVYTALRSNAEPDINALEIAAPARAPFNAVLGVRSADLGPDEVDLLRPRADEAMATLRADDTWRKIHDALFTGPTGELIVSVRTTRAALYLVRDPRDVAVSWSHHVGQSLAETVDFLCASRTALAGRTDRLEDQLRQRLGSWSEHVRSWTDDPPFPVHVLRYEDCLADPVAAFTAAFAATGLRATEEEVGEAVARSSLERLQSQEAATGFREHAGGGDRFFRRGSAGSWTEELPLELARRLEEAHGDVMARHGYLGAADCQNGKE